MDKRPRLLIIQGILPHYRVPFFCKLSRLGVEVTVAHSGAPSNPPAGSYDEVIVPQRSFKYLWYQSSLDQLADGFDAVVIPINPRFVSNYQLAMSLPKERLLLWGHGLARNGFFNKLRVRMAQRAAGIVLYDEAQMALLCARGIDKDRIFVAPNTIDVPNAGLDVNVARDQFTFVGRLNTYKGLSDLLRAFKSVASEVPDECGVTIIGDGPEADNLRGLSAELGIDSRVRLLRATTDAGVLRREFSRSLAYVSPGPVGLGVLHSFAYGVPVITRADADHGPEVGNVKDGINGVLVGPTIRHLADAMLEVANAPEKSLSMGQQAYRWYADTHTIDDMAEGMRSAIDAVIADAGLRSQPSLSRHRFEEVGS